MNPSDNDLKRSVYMTWAKRHAAARYNLANSGILPCGEEDFPTGGEPIPPNGPDGDGYAPLLEAVAAKHGVAPEQAVLAQGTSFANFLACATLLQPGDEALLEQPAYEPLMAAIRFLGATLKRFPRRHEEGWRIDPEEVARRISPRTRLIVLTSPHNPSGVVADGAALARIGELAAEAGARVLVDEVYRDALFEDAPSCAARISERFVTTGSLTKSYGLGGLRCGWILCEGELAERMRRLNDLMGAVGPVPAEALGALAFRRLPRLEARSRALLEPNTRLVHRFLEEHGDLLECVVPRRSLIVFPRLKGGAGADSLHDRLRKRETSIVPGRFFDSPAHFRLGFAVATEDVAEGLRRLSLTLREGPV